MKFEDFLTESAKMTKFAVKVGSGSWKEDVQLPWPNAKAIAKAVNGEKENIGAISDLLHGHYSSPHANVQDHLEILDASASLSGNGDTATVEFRWTTMRDRHREETAKILIQDQ